ncbi:MAG: tRNA (guanosine(46)-N7)-methyltransferase TrmB [Gammaproteobacteria bacterium]|nr:MAG: tRNA (guanosine(46)-N7)-methyltransferase TrmB [Gammaproteobacteria bacterium]
MAEEQQRRRIRSFVRREGRMTTSQKRALEELWGAYGIDVDDTLLDLNTVFPAIAPTILEIGFGNGNSLLTMAQNSPHNNYLGVEVHRPGVGNLLQNLERQAVGNVRIICHDAVEVVENNLAPQSLHGVHLFFPDPWPKRKHHKRRLLQPGFASRLATRLKPGAQFHIATDWQDYARHMMEVMSESGDFINTFAEGAYAPRPDDRPLTRFEQRGQRLGHEVWDLVFTKKPA